MLWSNWKRYIRADKIKHTDIAIVLILILLASFFWMGRMPLSEAFCVTERISLGYQAQQGKDGRYYVLDSGHERLICFDQEGVIQFTIEDPSDSQGRVSYIDDFFVTEEGIYIAASQWNEMRVDREAVLFFDNRGKYVKTVLNRDYTTKRTNKHKLYGVCEIDGTFAVVECLADEIRIGEKVIAYENAFNAVYDAVFVKDALYILNKDGTVKKYTKENPKGIIVYRTEGKEEQEPYRLAADQAGNVYFTDIRNKKICRIGEKNNSIVVYEETDSLTVGINMQGEYLLLDDTGMHVVGQGQEKTFQTLQKNGKMLLFQLGWFMAGFICALLFLVLLLRMGHYFRTRQYSDIQKMSFCVLGTVVAVSLLLTGILMRSFTDRYREKIEEQVECAAYMIAGQISGDDIEQIEADGGFEGEAYRRLYETMERAFPMHIRFYQQIYCNILKIPAEGGEGYAVAYLDQSVGAYFSLDAVEQEELKTVQRTGNTVWNQAVKDISGTYLSVKVPVYNSSGEICGAVAAGVETYVITDTLQELVKDILLSIVVILMLVWIVSVEILSNLYNYNTYRQEKNKEQKEVFPGHILRISIFLVFVAYNMTATFLPAYLLHQTGNFSDAFRSLAGALPITVNLFLIGVMALFCAGLIRRWGIRKLMVISTLCSCVGNGILFFFQGYAGACIGLFLDGVGVGLVTNAIYVWIGCIKNEEDRIRGLAIYNSACFSGINFGMLLGSLLAVLVNQQIVFGVVAVLWIILLITTGNMARKLNDICYISKQKRKENSVLSVGRFVKEKRVFGFLALVQNPYIIFGSFVFYYVPLFCDAKGYGEAVCSLFILIYSQTAVLLADSMTKFFSKRGQKRGMYQAMGINIAALVVYALFPDLTGMLAALFLLGLSAAFGKPVQQEYFLDLRETKQYGEDKAMGIYNFSENIGESMGPIIFGKIISSVGFQIAMGVFCTLAAGCGVLHHFFCGRESSANETREKNI